MQPGIPGQQIPGVTPQMTQFQQQMQQIQPMQPMMQAQMTGMQPGINQFQQLQMQQIMLMQAAASQMQFPAQQMTASGKLSSQSSFSGQIPRLQIPQIPQAQMNTMQMAHMMQMQLQNQNAFQMQQFQVPQAAQHTLHSSHNTGQHKPRRTKHKHNAPHPTIQQTLPTLPSQGTSPPQDPIDTPTPQPSSALPHSPAPAQSPMPATSPIQSTGPITPLPHTPPPQPSTVMFPAAVTPAMNAMFAQPHPVDNKTLAASIQSLPEEKAELFYRVFDCHSKKRDNRLEAFFSIFGHHIASSLPNAGRFIVDVVEQFKFGRELYQRLKDLPCPTIFRQVKNVRPAYKFVPAVSGQTDVTISFPKKPDVVAIGAFIGLPMDGPVQPLPIIIDKEEVHPVTFGDNNFFYMLTSPGRPSRSSVIFPNHRSLSARWFAVIYVTRQTTADVIVELADRANLKLREKDVVLAKTPQCQQGCSFELARIVDEAMTTGFAQCPHCMARVVFSELQLSTDRKNHKNTKSSQSSSQQQLLSAQSSNSVSSSNLNITANAVSNLNAVAASSISSAISPSAPQFELPPQSVPIQAVQQHQMSSQFTPRAHDVLSGTSTPTPHPPIPPPKAPNQKAPRVEDPATLQARSTYADGLSYVLRPRPRKEWVSMLESGPIKASGIPASVFMAESFHDWLEDD